MYRSLTLSLLLVSITNLVAAQDWTRFRGPNGTGVAESTSLPAEWGKDHYLWRTTLPGIGHSSPAVWGDRVFVLSADPDSATRYVLCHHADTGKELWRKTFESKTHHLHTRSSYASCSPAVDAEQVYIAWSTPEETLLRALTHDGEEVWSRDLGRWVSQHGFGTSPIRYRDMVILHNSQQANNLEPNQTPGDSFMMAFDARTGELRWQTELKSVNVCYSVPFIYEPENGNPELVCTSTGNGVFSLDPDTGEENWSILAFEMRTVSSPILAGGLIFGSTGSGRYSGNYIVAVKPGPQPEIRYQLKNSAGFKAPYVPSAVAEGNNVFLLYDRGFASCIDAPTGKIHWSERTGAAFSGSPVRVGDKIYCVDEDGVVWVIAADASQYRLLAKNDLGEPSRSTPAVSGGKMFLRTYSQLVCIGP